MTQTRLILLLGISLLPFSIQAQFFQPDTVLNPKRVKLATGFTLGTYSLTMLYMGVVWYGQEDLSPFHFFDDSHEWKQMDKAGHIFGGYQTSRMMINLYKWTGMPRKRAILTGAIGGFVAMSSIEVLDGFGESWGFSWSDIGANALGSSLAVLNESLWEEDRLILKFSYLRSPYTKDRDFDRLFGSNLAEWTLKDYNGQVIWLSVNAHAFLPEGKFKQHYPRWLNWAVGYGAQNLEGGYDDPLGEWKSREYRQWYVGVDIDLRRLYKKQNVWSFLTDIVNFGKIPAPALEGDRNGIRFKPFR